MLETTGSGHKLDIQWWWLLHHIRVGATRGTEGCQGQGGGVAAVLGQFLGFFGGYLSWSLVHKFFVTALGCWAYNNPLITTNGEPLGDGCAKGA